MLPSRHGHARFLGPMLASASMSGELPWSEGPVIPAIGVRRRDLALGMVTLDSRAESASGLGMATLDSRAEADAAFGMATLDSSAETAFGMATLDSKASEAFMATLDSTAAAAFMQAWPFVAYWFTFYRKAISDEYFRAREESLVEACFEAWWNEAFADSTSQMDDEEEEYSSDFTEPESGPNLYYYQLHLLGDQSRRDHNVCVYKLKPVRSHICGSLGACSYMRHSLLNMPVDKVVVLELIVILLRAQSWEPL